MSKTKSIIKIPSISEFKSKFGSRVWADIAQMLINKHSLTVTSLRRSESGENIVFFIDETMMLKIFIPQKNGFMREKTALEFFSNALPFQVPVIVADGEIEGFHYLITSQCGGRPITRKEWLNMDQRKQIGMLTQLAAGLKEIHSLDATNIDFDWGRFLRTQIETAIGKQRADPGNSEWIESVPLYLENYVHLIPETTAEAFQHGDVHFGNLRVKDKGGNPRVCGIFDFADSIKGFHEYEFVAIGVLMIQGQGELQREFFRAYGYRDIDIDENLRRRMMTLTLLYEYSSLRRYSERLCPEAVNYSLAELEREIWNFC